MAEANVMEVEMVDFQGGEMKYFCHRCSLEIDPKLPGLTCPLCNSGFIEELTDNLQRDREVTSSTMPNVTDQLLMDLLTSQPSRTQYDDDEDDGEESGVWNRSRLSLSSLRSSSRRQPQRSAERGGLPLHSFIETVLGSLRDDSYRRFGADFSEPRLRRYDQEYRRNDQDFRRTYGGLEDLFTQILTQLTASGPQPASQTQIDELPMVVVRSHHLENSAQCSICLENFILLEEVTSLPCSHLHHRYCIIPWLQLHGTCPVCRHVLSTNSSENTISSSPFRFTDRADLSLEPEDLFSTTHEELEAMPTSMTVHPAWEVIRLPGLDNSIPEESFDIASGGRLNNNAPRPLPDIIEMVDLENDNSVAAMDVDLDKNEVATTGDERYTTAVETLDYEHPPSTLTYLKDIEVTGIESELESDL